MKKSFYQLTVQGQGRRFRRASLAALAHYDLEPVKVSLLSRETPVFRVDAYANPTVLSAHRLKNDHLMERYILRIDRRFLFTDRPPSQVFGPAEHAAGIHLQMLWQEALNTESNLVVPQPIRNHHGDLVTEVEIEGVPGTLRCGLCQWLPGRIVTSNDGWGTPRQMYLRGQLTARLHLHAEQFKSPESVAPPRSDWGEGFQKTMDILRKSLNTGILSQKDFAVLEKGAERVLALMEVLGVKGDQFGLVHGDLRWQNIVFHNGQASPIDFGECRWGYYLWDLMRAFTPTSDARFGLHQGTFFEGYQSLRQLPPDYREPLETFRSMEEMNWIHHALLCCIPKIRTWQTQTQLPCVVQRISRFLSGEPLRLGHRC